MRAAGLLAAALLAGVAAEEDYRDLPQELRPKPAQEIKDSVARTLRDKAKLAAAGDETAGEGLRPGRGKPVTFRANKPNPGQAAGSSYQGAETITVRPPQTVPKSKRRRRREDGARLVAQNALKVGDKVKRRDGSNPWGVGFVVQTEPLLITSSETDPSAQGFKWDEVELIDSAAPVTSQDRGIDVPPPPEDRTLTLRKRIARLEQFLADAVAEGVVQETGNDKELGKADEANIQDVMLVLERLALWYLELKVRDPPPAPPPVPLAERDFSKVDWYELKQMLAERTLPSRGMSRAEMIARLQKAGDAQSDAPEKAPRSRARLPEGAATGRLEPEHGATSAADVAAARAKIESENCLPADSDDYKNAEHHEYCVMGAGPGGLQAAEFLRAAGRDYVVFEKAASAGAFFKTYPRHRQLISINKRNTGRDNEEFNLRHDWNSLLTVDRPMRPFRDFSPEYFPPADAWVRRASPAQASAFATLVWALKCCCACASSTMRRSTPTASSSATTLKWSRSLRRAS